MVIFLSDLLLIICFHYISIHKKTKIFMKKMKQVQQDFSKEMKLLDHWKTFKHTTYFLDLKYKLKGGKNSLNSLGLFQTVFPLTSHRAIPTL